MLQEVAAVARAVGAPEAGLERDPAAAIASCKEFVESLCKIILERQGIEFPPGEDLPPLFKRVTTLLGLHADAVADNAKVSATVVKILRTLTTTVQPQRRTNAHTLAAATEAR